jgi:hypothetical protein
LRLVLEPQLYGRAGREPVADRRDRLGEAFLIRISQQLALSGDAHPTPAHPKCRLPSPAIRATEQADISIEHCLGVWSEFWHWVRRIGLSIRFGWFAGDKSAN